jgi:hypothetical protein
MQQKNYLNFIKAKSMKANENMERVYELLEQFNFGELPAHDKSYILSVMSESEYTNLRSTLTDTEIFFANAEELNLNESLYKALINKRKNENFLIRVLKQPVQFYKVAASVLIILGLFSIFHYTNLNDNNKKKTSNDTIYIYKTDTVYSRFVDTVKLIKEKIVYITQKKEPDPSFKLLSAAKSDYDSSKEICPNDIDRIKAFVFNNNVSNDTLFKN